MRFATYLTAVFLLLGCTEGVRNANHSSSQFDLLSLHWEARGSTNDVRWCDLSGTGERIPLEPEVILGMRHFAAAHVTHDRANSVHSVDVEMTPEGKGRIKELSSANIGRRLAIVVDNDVAALATVWRTIDTDRVNLMPMADAHVAEDLAKRINAAILRENNGS